MKIQKRRSCLLSLAMIVCVALPVFAQKGIVKGTITDTEGNPMPYANIVIAGQAAGASTNVQGEYRLTLPYGTYTLHYKFIGYRLLSQTVEVDKPSTTLDIVLEEQAVKLEELEIRSDMEDPAYEIIRQAQDRRKAYKEEFSQQTLEAYTRLFGKGETLSYSQLHVFGTDMTASSGVFYLSETFSTVKREKDRSLEEITASLVMEDSSSLSANKSIFLDFYRNRALKLNQTEMVSPIAADAMSFYDYEYEGVFEEEGQVVNKIKLRPKAPGMPAFKGYVYILEDSWRLHSLDLRTRGRSAGNIGKVDVKVTYTPLPDSEVRVPFSVDLRLDMSAGVVRYYSLFSSFTPKVDLSGEPADLRLRIAEGANTKPAVFWEENRPIPLTEDERKAYIEEPKPEYRKFEFPTDSTEASADTTAIADNLREMAEKRERAEKIMKITKVFNGGKKSLSSKVTFEHGGILSIFDYNLVEGWVLKFNPRFTYKSKKDKLHQLQADFRYGFSGKRPYAQLRSIFQLNKERQEKLTISGGHYIKQYAGKQVITPALNAYYTLFRNRNFVKLYEKTYAKAAYEAILLKNFDFRLGAEVARRSPLENSTDFKFFGSGERSFTPNQPIVAGQPLGFSEHTAYLFDVGLAIHLDRPYELRGKKRKYLPSQLPIISLSYRQGMGDVDFQQWHATLKDDFRLGILGNSSIRLSYGDFISRERVTPIDFFHFAGNRTYIRQVEQVSGLSYQLLSYYGYSTTGAFFGGNYEHSFKGVVMSKIPLLKKLGGHLVASASYLHTDQIDNYVEVGLGLSNIFSLLRFDYYRSMGDRANSVAGFRLTVPAI